MTTTNSFFRREQQISSVRLARNSNLSGTYYNGSLNNGIGATFTVAASSLTIDSVACALEDRILLLAQTNGYENGIYRVSSIGSTVVLTRAPDFQEFDQMKPGYYIPVAAGTELHGALFGIVEPQVQVVGTDSIVFANSAASPDSVTLANTGLQIYDTNASHLLTIAPGSDLTAARTLTLTTGDAARTITLSGNPTLSDWFDQSVKTTASPTFADPIISATITIPNSGLHVLDTNASHDLVITPGSDLTADRILTVTTGDAARTLDISAASVTVSSFGSTLVDDASKLVALTTLGVKRGTTAAYGGGGTSNAFVAAGLVATDIVVAQTLNSTNNVSITQAVPTADTLTVRYSADPGAASTVSWIAIATV